MDDELRRTVRSGELALCVRVRGDSGRPTVVLVHGFPDTQAVWDPVADRLVRAGLRVVTYDVWGAGHSGTPSTRSGYRVERLVDDLVAVLDDTVPHADPVHLVGHDWGSVQLWAAVTTEEQDDRLHGRIASYTSISRPALEQFGHFLSSSVASRQWRPLRRQLVRSWYISAFQVPFVAELVFRRFGDAIRSALTRSQHLGPDAHWTGTFADDAAHGVNLYRANATHGTHAAAPPRTRVPVQLVVPIRDRFLIPALYAALPRFVDDLTRVDIDAGHWAPQTHPAAAADAVTGFVRGR